MLDKILGAESGVSAMSSNASQSNQNDNSSEGSQVPPEDKIELFCNNVVCNRASILLASKNLQRINATFIISFSVSRSKHGLADGAAFHLEAIG